MVRCDKEIRPGTPILKVVDASVMQVRARVNQADVGHLSVGQPARITLDAYPGLLFEGRVEQLAPLAVPSSLTPRVRTFTGIISIAGAHEQLMPDLSAGVDIDLANRAGSSPEPRRSAVEDP